MSGSLFLMCKYKTATFVVCINEGQTFQGFAADLRKKYSIADHEPLSLHYNVLGHPRVDLLSDLDLHNLLNLAEVLSLKCVDLIIEVDQDSLATHKADSNQQIGRAHDSPRGSNGCNISQDPIQSESLIVKQSCTNQRLLTSGWSLHLSHVGQIFEEGKQQFKSALCKYSIEKGFNFVYRKNRLDKVYAVCEFNKDHKCTWYVIGRQSRVNGYWYISHMNTEHTCNAITKNKPSDRLSYYHIADLIVDLLKTDSNIGIKGVVNHFQQNYGLQITYRKAGLVLEKARGLIFGNDTDSYKILGQYLSVALENNPGSHCVLDLEEGSHRFHRLFLSFSACIIGFNDCRPLLFLDGTFLKGRFKGILLSATGKDGNQGLYPLAFGFVDSETADNWRWFLTELRKIIDIGRTINFVSDRNLGLVDALRQVFPTSNHFFCVEHLKNNLRDKFNGKQFSHTFREHIVTLFRDCAYENSPDVFQKKFDSLRSSGGVIVHRFLEGIQMKQWTKLYSGGCRYGEMTSNAAESFNAWINDIRNLPITHCVDELRKKLTKWFVERAEASKAWNGVLCPKVTAKVDNYVQEGRTWIVRKCSDTIHEVYSNPSAVVDMQMHTCSCNGWKNDKFPCAHACVVICRSNTPIHYAFDTHYYVVSYKMAYKEVIFPFPANFMTDTSSVEANDVLPPISKKQPGRPRKRRFKSRGELTRTFKCGRCGKIGNHTKRTCNETTQLL